MNGNATVILAHRSTLLEGSKVIRKIEREAQAAGYGGYPYYTGLPCY